MFDYFRLFSDYFDYFLTIPFKACFPAYPGVPLRQKLKGATESGHVANKSQVSSGVS